MQSIKIKRGFNKKFRYSKSIEDIRKLISEHRINFFIGTGFSLPLLKPQRNIDLILNTLNACAKNYDYVKAYLLWNFFRESINPLLRLDINVSPQKQFTKNIKSILENKEIPLLTNQINVFTTNFDPLLEMGFNKNDDIKYNDGLYGKTVPVFSIENYMELKTEQIIYYSELDKDEQEMEIPNYIDKPTINIFKLHGSLTWKRNVLNNNIEYVDYHIIISNFNNKYKDVFDPEITNTINELCDREFHERKTYKLLKRLFKRHNNKKLDKCIEQFFEDFYNTFMIVDPIKRKFLSESIELYYNKLLDVFRSELSKENALMFVFGSQFKDSHIRDSIQNILKNSALILYIFCTQQDDMKKFETYFAEFGDNVKLIYPHKSSYTLNDFNDLLEYINKGNKNK